MFVVTRMSRAEQVERNRARVLDGARAVFLAQGYGGATVDAIALEAGFSKGVVYSQFAGKGDLFLALLEERIDLRAAENARLAEGRSGLAGLRDLLAASARRDAEDAGWGLLLVEFRVVAARDADLGARYAALHARSVGAFAALVEQVLARDGLTTVGPAGQVAGVVFALGTGLALERAAGTAAVPDAVLDAVTAALVVPAGTRPDPSTPEEPR